MVMLLTARMLKDVSTANHFTYAEQVEFLEGNTPTIYFQLADGSVEQDMRPPGRRYIPAAGAVVQVTLQSINTGTTIVRNATNPFPEDRSIFAFDILPTDTILGTRNLKLKLTEGTSVAYGFVEQAVVVRPVGPEF